jgi:alpha-2-macroglobulin
MDQLKKHKAYIIALLISFAILIGVFVIVFGKGKKEVVKIDPEFSKYITAYTSGIISKNSSIKIILSSEVRAKIQNADSLPEDLFYFEPEINGSTYWQDENTIEFKPDQALPSNTFYLAGFNLGKLIDTDEKFRVFNFNFKTIKQNFKVFQLEQKSDKPYQKVICQLSMSDVESLDKVKEMIFARYRGIQKNISWQEGNNSKQYVFEIDSLKRDDQTSILSIEWNGEFLNVDSKGSFDIEIPAINEFKYMFHRVVQFPEQELHVQFSDKILETQDVEGLIRIENVEMFQTIIRDNVIQIVPVERLKGLYNISVDAGLKNTDNSNLENNLSFSVSFEDIKPEVRFTSSGTILPSSKEGLVLPFEAVNLSAVDVQVFKIHSDNVLQFLQVNHIDGNYELQRVGKAMIKKTIRLDNTDITDFSVWNRFVLDLNDIIKVEPGSIYNISLGFKKEYSLYNCNDESNAESDNLKTVFSDGTTSFDEHSEYDYYDYYYDENYWERRDDPCFDAYYGTHRVVTKNILATDIALIAKKGNDNSLDIIATNIKTAEPVVEAQIKLYDFQQQLLSTLSTNTEGMCRSDNAADVYFVVAEYNNQYCYLRLQDGYSLSLSKFDVAGVGVQKGMKGFIYGERGVWRPGDSLFLTFILKEDQNLPENHPVVFEFKNPSNQIVRKIVSSKNSSGFYSFAVNTDLDAPTGYWNAEVSVGGNVFSKQIRIETIKPNRLKIKLDFGTDVLRADNISKGILSCSWLHGAIAKNLKAKVDVVIKQAETTFPNYTEYNFVNPSSSFYPEEYTHFEGNIDEQGRAYINSDFELQNIANGKLDVSFVTRVFENGGDFSIDQFTLPYHPYNSYTGIKSPKGSEYGNVLFTDHNAQN